MRPDEVPRIGRDPATLEAFYREHVEAVQRFVARRVDDPRLAADLTAEVFLAAVEAAPSYRPRRGAPGAWLGGIARPVVASEHRRARRAGARGARGGGGPPATSSPRSPAAPAASAPPAPASTPAPCSSRTTSPGCRSASTPPPRAASCTPRWRACPTASGPCSSWSR